MSIFGTCESYCIAVMERILLFCVFIIFLGASTKITAEDQRLYLETERPVLTYVNPKYYSYLNFTTTRFGRRNPLYYVNLHFTSLFTFDNNLTVSFWFYEYYSSHYRRSFLEMSFKWCNLVYKDAFFGPALRKNLPKSCPHKPVQLLVKDHNGVQNTMTQLMPVSHEGSKIVSVVESGHRIVILKFGRGNSKIVLWYHCTKGDYHLLNMTVAITAMPRFPFTKGRIYCNLTLKQETTAAGYIDMELKRKRNRSQSLLLIKSDT